MRYFATFIFIIACAVFTQAQTTTSLVRKGFIFGTAGGVSVIHLSTPSLADQTAVQPSFPNFKIGAMLSKRTALVLYLPGTIYTYKGAGRARSRGFEGIIPTVQYWAKERWWVMGGAGLTFDAPAFYDIKTADERKFYFGPSILAGTGYELWRKGRFALDIQFRVHYGTANVLEGTQKGLSSTCLLGLNWY